MPERSEGLNDMADKIFFTPAKGGAGCTTVVTGVAFALAAAGERTLVIDGDNACGCGLEICGCAGIQVFTAEDYAEGKCRAKQATVQHPKYRNMYIMPTTGLADKTALKSAIGELDGLFDYILCDGAAAGACGRAVVVTEPYSPCVKACDVAVSRLKDGGMKNTGIIINKVNGGLILGGDIPYPEDIAAAVNAPLTGMIPEDLSLTVGVWRRYSGAYFKIAAQRLAGRQTKIPYIENEYSGAGGYFRRKMRSRI